MLRTLSLLLLQVPVINSRPLDLYLLYRTVCAKGGMEDVVQKKAWKVRGPPQGADKFLFISFFGPALAVPHRLRQGRDGGRGAEEGVGGASVGPGAECCLFLDSFGPVIAVPPLHSPQTHGQLVRCLLLPPLLRRHPPGGGRQRVQLPRDFHPSNTTLAPTPHPHRPAQEVASVFNFPETITSSSYQLRKAYVNLLWDFEQAG